MAWTETCKIDFKKQINHKKDQGVSIRQALKQLSEESGISVNTLNSWLYPRDYTKKDSVVETYHAPEENVSETGNSDNAFDGFITTEEKANIVKDAETQMLRQANEVKKQKKKIEIQTAQKKVAAEYQEKTIPSIILKRDHTDYNPQCDLLITDPPYMTDIEDISEFVKWLPKKLECVKDTGFAFVFIGAYPEELKAYLGISMPTQVLVWTYRNTLGVTPKNIYKLNWQVILFYRMKNSPQLNCPLTNEQWAVQDYNAPDGRHGERYHAWEKPMKLAEALIRHTTKKGDTIFDCFAGTGTFLLAASKLGRKSIGCEIDNDMVKIAIDRGCQLG